MLLTMLVCPIKPLMGRDEILQQTPLKHPQIVPNTHGKVFAPHYDHSSMNLSLFDKKQSHLTIIKTRNFKSLKI
ncbi:hypothetical protein [Helicobacter pylori]|uniref:hypothetical protein n=1 Tax=Helicobacter pylori TaxID=210 RepID=UPI001BB2F2F8|nr:hypothetical protein [Helicobacter pylori]